MQIGQALVLMHRTLEREWSVAALAGAVAMLRSVFSARFTASAGEPAMQYLTQWRTQLATNGQPGSAAIDGRTAGYDRPSG